MKKLVASFLFLAAFAPIGLVAGDASACGMSVRLEPIPERPTPVQEIATGEKSLDSGNYLAAANAVTRTFPAIRNATAGTDPLQTRGLRVLAMSIVRSDGKVAANGQWTPAANLEWAAQTLREIDQKRPNDPAVQADLGEALAKITRTQGEAYKLLSRLADKDLMGSPHAYAALAQLRASKGDEQGMAAAVKRCEEMTKSPAVCKVSPAAKPAEKPGSVAVAAKVAML
ncbi:MAG: hypothetical protein JNL38_20395 [Myxococcales bacterium]|nr:hypothetical protein [Myxococcales bacterium]